MSSSTASLLCRPLMFSGLTARTASRFVPCVSTLLVGRPCVLVAAPSRSFSRFPSRTPVRAPAHGLQVRHHATEAWTEPPEVDFFDSKTAFKNKSTLDIVRTIVVYRLCSIKLLVRHSLSLIALSEKILGKRLTVWILKQTFFKQFCAGETAQDILPTIDYLRRSGVGAILDYAAEADVTQEQEKRKAGPPERKEGVVSARVYDYEGEAECDANAKIFMSCIDASAQRENGFAAIKLTALGKPELLLRISQVLFDLRNMFRSLVDESQPQPNPDYLYHLPQPLYSRTITRDAFARGLHKLGYRFTEQQLSEMFSQVDKNKSGLIDYLEWVEYIHPGNVHTRPFFTQGSERLHSLNEDEIRQLDNMFARLEPLADAAQAKSVRLMIDAEQTYFQPAIDHIVIHLQRKYNREFPTIYTTIQAYLTDAYARLLLDLERARQEKFHYACKVVRGAYMVQERKRAQEKGYEDPIWPSIEHTHQCYDNIVETLLDHGHRASVIVATHNVDSVQRTLAKMRALHIPHTSPNVCFGQLLGMRDQVTFTLGMAGYRAYKYLPYGPVQLVLPYLIRRAEENSDMLGGAVVERKMLTRELLRRLTFRG